MVVRIRSLLAAGPVHVPLNSGGTVRLSPGGLSAELPELEVTGNERVAKLLGRRAIEVVAGETAAEPAGDTDQSARSRRRAAAAEQPAER